MSGHMTGNTFPIEAAFPPEIATRIIHAIGRYPDLQPLFQDIARHASATKSISIPANNKKRKLEDGVPASSAHTNGIHATVGISNPTVAYECKDVSFQVPARKKLKLQLVADANDNTRQEVRLQNQQSIAVDYSLPAAQIDQVFCLPVPEKQQRQWNFVVFPKPGATTADGVACEQVVFTMGEVAATGATSTGQHITVQDTFITVTERELNALLQPQGKHVVTPNTAEFVSSIPQPHRKGEKAYHVKAHRGSKDGYLFLLPNGIVSGFRKPLAFFPFATIEAISYTSVLQRTFNLVITSREPLTAAAAAAAQEEEDGKTKDVEFSMIDQADFAGIDGYIKRHGLNDASMAGERRAKAYNVNKIKREEGSVDGGAEVGGVTEGDGLTELQRAELQLQDAEDEEEEDYVESGGESDGEGEEDSEGEDAEEGGRRGRDGGERRR
ncbi:hypothetical protein LTR35_004258 [Friedmanniomyces endolithicus]|uniref:Histone chaperone RTT106/FACT complex subunit SPT16-like middle domain-containing protein n=1 Tax=Friedmanniomyces endolithicus TaxID=329885 RepID=A0AAN6JDW3_9PEZI|nr:hypothetical protein LTR35_004258 [Friedmanniomyces endolithicus]KAK0294494.1 hypothetical protein LTS00_007085 [Friedmanniomyces endolithicus]KAK0326653.1 hypothetical protein LTR82_002495 [Friedmanniomyces endolithicus]KAK1017605.1 hypothetical protein LTR54_002263 [Friedmanniomyces endolithicus]